MKENQKNKFKTPEGYFENFNERLMNRMEAEKDQIAGSLIPKTDGFGVPDGYFDGIDQAVKNKLDAGSKVISLRSYRNYYYAAASIAALFVLILAWNWNNNPEMGFDDLANTEIDAYFESNEFGLSSYEIAEVLPVENIGIVDITDSQIEEENIFEYLNDNIEDLDELNLEYDELE